MAGKAKLRKRAEPVNWTVDIFDVEMDEEARAEMAADPSGFVRNVFESEGMPINNGLLVEDRTGGAEQNQTIWFHVTAPPQYKCKKGTITTSETDEGPPVGEPGFQKAVPED